jgi:hypothetical protein
VFDGEENETVWIFVQEWLARKECVGFNDRRGRLNEGGFVSTESLPIVAIVVKEVGDLTEDFERDSVS